MFFIRFESNLWIRPVSLFRCDVCVVFLLFGPSMRSMSPGWKMSLLWVTVKVTVLCTCLRSIILVRYFTSLTIYWVLGVLYGKRQMKSLIPCSEMTPTLPTLLARCSSCGRGTIVWPLGVGTLISITPSIRIGIYRLTALSWIQGTAPQSSWMLWMTWTGEFLGFSFAIPCFIPNCLSFSFVCLLGPPSTTMSKTTSLPNCFAFAPLGKWSLRISKTSFQFPTTRLAKLRWKRILLGIPLPWTFLSNSYTR